MAIDFPNSPNTGDVHSDGGASWRWSGYAWRRIPDPGAKGEPGAKGDKGQKGEVGLTGSQGDKGEKGAPSTVAGAKGQKGEDGQKGATGTTGDKGAKGEPSTVAGDKGDKGDKGGTGAGTKGEKGAGSSVTIGVSPPTSPTPAPGDMWWDSDDADLHVYYNDGNSAQWVSVTSSAALKGQTGDKGQKGEIGTTGAKGEIGEKGQKGEIGATGGTGGTGPQGIKGQKGEEGAVAAKGQKGEIGSTGGTGGTGAAGDKGQKGEIGNAGSTGIPSGFIGLWSGAANAIPSGWYLCNGSNGTPDLRGRFVVGYNNNDSLFDVDDTGGSKDAILVSHTHNLQNHVHGFTASTDSQGAHTHTYSSATSTNRVDNDETHQYLYSNTTQNTGSAGAHTHTISGNTGTPSTNTTDTLGESATNKNLPPYYALCYIMKA